MPIPPYAPRLQTNSGIGRLTGIQPRRPGPAINGLRVLADYLESNPEVPAPAYPVVHTLPAVGEWPQMCAEIDATAARLGVNAHLTGGGHYVAVRFFGPVEY